MRPARVVRRPRQGRSPSSFCEYQNAGPRQGRSPAPPGSLAGPPGSGRSPPHRASIGSTVPACFLECVVGRLRRVVRRPPKVVRRPRQGGPHLGMWLLVGATFCHVVFSGGHILEMGRPRDRPRAYSKPLFLC